MEMPTPGPAHHTLSRLVGVWIGEERLSPSPFDAAGGTAIGRTINRPALGGFIVVQDYEQERDGTVNFRGHGIFSHDETTGSYRFHWYDSMGGPPADYRGAWRGDVLQLLAQDARGHSRASFDFGTPDRYRFQLEVSPDGQSWFTVMEGDYGRQT